LDDLDRRILRSVRFNGRLSNAEIARQVEVSEGTVRRRIAALRDARMLRFVAIADPRVLGFHLDTLIGIRADGHAVVEIAEHLAERPEVSYLSLSMGSFDIWADALFPSTDAWLAFRTWAGGLEGVRQSETFLNTRILKQNFDGWGVSDERLMGDRARSTGGDGGPGATAIGPAKSLELDELDRRILHALRFDGRLSNAEVARQVEVSEGTVRRRISALRAAHVLNVVAITDPRAAGYLHALVGIRADGDAVLEIAHELVERPEVPYVALSMGSFDIWVGALFPSTDAWLEFRTRLGKLAGVREMEPFLITRILKQNFHDWDEAEETLRVNDARA
jgi:Lrp/AsnC family transcriptional regulator, regulator for asnA, asnC and gidA